LPAGEVKVPTHVTVPHQAWNWATVPGKQISDGVIRQVIHGKTLMICRLTISPGTMTVAHQHLNEQMTIIEKGRVRFVLGTGEQVFGPGDILLLPSSFWHGATALDEEVVLIDIFSPIRKEFLRPARGGAGQDA
jgi:quercetin dioxygenase-like cupin family protein